MTAKPNDRSRSRGLLRELDDPALAAHQFAALVMDVPMKQAMFCGPEELASPADLQRVGDSAVRVFLAAYGPQNAGA
jgi:transcriptional repressor AefR-like protein